MNALSVMAEKCVPVTSSESGGWQKELQELALAREESRSLARRVKPTVSCPTPSALPLLLQLQCTPGSRDARTSPEPECPNGNMRLFDVDVSSDFIIGSYKYETNGDKPPRPIVNGGEKSPKKSPTKQGMDRHKTARIVQALRKEEKDEDYESDSSEELQYGPGIVNKLKTKYLSLTLRENQKRGVRPSLANLRRSTSLENILDDDSSPIPPKTQYFKKSFHSSSRNSKVSQYCAKYMSINQHGRESIKRAQSVDALYRNEPKCTVVITKSNTVESRMSNGTDVVITESSSDASLPKAPEVAKELPPPDLVKQTLKIFETKTTDTGTVLKPKTIKAPAKPPVSEKKVAVKPVVLPKPVLSGDKVSSKPRSPVKRHAAFSNPPETKPPAIKPKSEYYVRLLSPPPSTEVLHSPDNLVDKKYISTKALENIEKEGSMVKYTFSDSLAPTKSYLPKIAQATNNVLVNNGIDRPPPKAEAPSSPVKQVAVIRPVVTNKIHQQNRLTDVEIEKNHINKVKSVEINSVQVEAKNVECEPGETDKSEKVTLWGDTKNRQQNQNTMVFNFVNRKEIPDYIENDGLVFTPKKDRVKVRSLLILTPYPFSQLNYPHILYSPLPYLKVDLMMHNLETCVYSFI